MYDKIIIYLSDFSKYNPQKIYFIWSTNNLIYSVVLFVVYKTNGLSEMRAPFVC